MGNSDEMIRKLQLFEAYFTMFVQATLNALIYLVCISAKTTILVR
jgi:hypothetical protein